MHLSFSLPLVAMACMWTHHEAQHNGEKVAVWRAQPGYEEHRLCPMCWHGKKQERDGCGPNDARNLRGNAVSKTAALDTKWPSAHFMGLSQTKKAAYLTEHLPFCDTVPSKQWCAPSRSHHVAGRARLLRI